VQALQYTLKKQVLWETWRVSENAFLVSPSPLKLGNTALFLGNNALLSAPSFPRVVNESIALTRSVRSTIIPSMWCTERMRDKDGIKQQGKLMYTEY
jgi:hypothetical protein